MEDSGIDSEDKLSTVFDEQPVVSQAGSPKDRSPGHHMADLEVAFRGAGAGGDSATLDSYKQRSTDSTTGGSMDSDEGSSIGRIQPPSTCRILQRKLELKVERAKRNFNQYQEEQAKKSQSSTLIPINLLPIPGDGDQKPLVDYKSDSSEAVEEISFFPAKVKNARKHSNAMTLSDTFSIQEMTIDSDLDSDDSASQNLELLPPMLRSANVLDRLKSCFGCSSYGS